MSWPTAKLADVADISTGSTPKTDNASNWGSHIPFVTPGDLGKSAPIMVAERGLSLQGLGSARLVPSGSTLVCCIGSLGKSGFAGVDLTTNQQINAVSFDPKKFDARFGYYACLRLAPELQKMAPATTVPIVNKSLFSGLIVSMPPLDEQRRIAAILDKADALRQTRKRTIALLNNLTQSIFLEMFGDRLAELPHEKLGALTTDARIGLVRSAKEFGPQFSIPYVRMDAIGRDGLLNTEGIQRTSANEKEIVTYELRDGDFLFNTRNSRELVGKSAVFYGERGMVYNNNLLRMRFGGRLVPEYLAAYFRTDQGRQALEERKSGTTSVFAIYQKALGALSIPIAPIIDQREFAARVRVTLKLRASLQRQEAGAVTLFASLQNRAFSGQL